MNTHITTPRHFRLYGAVLAMAALLLTLLAVTLTAGPAMAQEPRTGDNTEEYDKPYPCSEEAVPDANTAGLIRDGYYAVFDGFWDYEVGHLSNNFCPPKVTETTKYDPDADKNVTVTTRSDANIHISETVFSIPDSYKVTVIDSGIANGTSSDVTGSTIDLAHFKFLKEGGAVSATKTDKGVTNFANNTLYWVRLDNPVLENAGAKSPLQIGFSTALLEEADWYKDDDEDPKTAEKPVQLRFAAVHVLKDGTPQEAHVLGAHFFAFDPGSSQAEALWSNVKTDTESEVYMFTGQYRPMQFVFTKPGRYLVQAQVQGHVRESKDGTAAPEGGYPEDWKPISPDKTITSPVQWYTFHVGSEADLSVSIKPSAVYSDSAGRNAVDISFTAHNAGPDGAENVEAEIRLPAGLSLPSTLPAGFTSNECGVIVWKPEGGSLGANSEVSQTVSVTVDNSAATNLTATAEIRSTTFDTDTANNADSAGVTLRFAKVRAPFFPGVSRTIVEHAVPGAHAGDPVAAVNPDGRVLTYTLSGPCSNKFQVHSNGQIVLAAGHTLDYQKQWEYPLTLHVSDGVNASGAADPSIDDSTPALIRVEDTEAGAVHPTVTFTLTKPNSDEPATSSAPRAGTVFIRTHVNNPPPGVDLTYTWEEEGWYNPTPFHTSYYSALVPDRPDDVTYTVHIKWDGGGITASYTVKWTPS